MIRSCSHLKVRWGGIIAAVALLWMAAARTAWGQSAWPSYPNNSAISVTSGGNVGIGTASPSAKLDVQGSGNGHVMIGEWTSNAAYAGLSLHGALSNGAYTFLGSPADNNLYVNRPGGGEIRIGENNSQNQLVIKSGGNVGIGTTNPQYKLAVNGNIGAQDIIVTNTGWSDYVFRPGYRLRPLSEVSQFIQKNGHLPDIPTEAEVKEKGVSLGDMQAKLLAKVEELTLHMIQQDNENRDLRQHMTQQEKENQELRERLARLEKSTTTDSTPAVAK